MLGFALFFAVIVMGAYIVLALVILSVVPALIWSFTLKFFIAKNKIGFFAILFRESLAYLLFSSLFAGSFGLMIWLSPFVSGWLGFLPPWVSFFYVFFFTLLSIPIMLFVARRSHEKVFKNFPVSENAIVMISRIQVGIYFLLFFLLCMVIFMSKQRF